MLTLAAFTNAINLVALAISLWLGLYVVTRSHNSGTARLAAAALWVLAAYFFQGALSIKYQEFDSARLRLLILFLIPIWIHLTYLLLPVGLRRDWMRWVIIPLGYAIAAFFLVLGALTDLVFGLQIAEPLYTNARPPGAAYVVTIPFYIVGLALMSFNLWRARQTSPNSSQKASLDMFIAATAIVAAAGGYIIGGTYLELALPFWVADLGLAGGIFLFGYAVARYNATLDGRPIERDFSYTLLVVGSLTLFYCVIVWWLYLRGEVSFLTLALTVIGTVVANSLFDRLRLSFDRFFYQGHFRQLRANLRVLAREAGTGQTLARRLQTILNSACTFLAIRSGFIAVLENGQYVIRATHESQPVNTLFPTQTLAANEIVGLVLPARKNLQDLKLLIPLYAESTQIGAVVLGQRENGEEYTEADLELLEDLGDQIARIIHGVFSQEQFAQRLNAQVQDFRERERKLQIQEQQVEIEQPGAAKPGTVQWEETKLVPLVEEGLRRLHDYAFLGEHALGQLRVVEMRLAKRQSAVPMTFLERGKVVSEILTDAVTELRPDMPLPKGKDVLPREWHLYTILYDSYVEGEPNREIMSKLYISEGTFHRTRRRAVRAVAKALAEMEDKTPVTR